MPCVSFVIRGSFVCGEGGLAATAAAAAAAAASASLVFRLSSSSWFACCLLCDTCSVVAATTRLVWYDASSKNLHATEVCCCRSNSGVRCKPSSYSSAACGSFVTRGYLHLVLLRARWCCCCELRAAGRAYSYLLLVQKAKRHEPTYLS